MQMRTRRTVCLTAHAVLLAGVALVALPALAEGPAALFWQLDAPSLGEGGADVPGQIRHTPQVARPTSLSEALRPQARLDYSSQSPLAVRQGGSDMTSWRSDVTREQAVVPLGRHRARPALAVGFLRNKSLDRLSYHDGDRQAQVEVSSHETTWAASGEIGFGVTLGAATTSGDASSSASGASLTKYLDLPANAPQWPSVNSDLKSYSLGVTQRIGRLAWGYQHDRSSPTSTLRVARADTDYTAPMDSASRRREAYVTLDTRRGTFFATRSNYVSDSAGTVFVGLIGRGDTQLHLEEQRGMIGWRQTSRTAVNQIVLDYRRSAFSTYDQGYAGILPGLFADVHIEYFETGQIGSGCHASRKFIGQTATGSNETPFLDLP